MDPASERDRLQAAADELAAACDRMTFGGEAGLVYNPLVYARPGYAAYVERYGQGTGRVLLVGMNPGPFGMVQTGVPFGHVGLVRDWMGIHATIGVPPREHPKRPVTGFACAREEVSGRRLWGWAKSRFGTAERFFRDFFVVNYCPLAFVEESGRNRTPDKLPAAARAALFAACDAALAECIDALDPRLVVGIGAFAAERACAAASARGVACGAIPHPSPASPAANRGWSEAAEKAFAGLGVTLPDAPEDAASGHTSVGHSVSRGSRRGQQP